MSELRCWLAVRSLSVILWPYITILLELVGCNSFCGLSIVDFVELLHGSFR